MKICLIADATSVHTLRWAEYFIAQGDEVHLITYEPPETYIPGINLHVISSLFQNLYLSFIPRHIKIYFLVKKIKPDIIHAHFISKFGFHAAFLGVHPLVMSAWGDDILIIPHSSRFLRYFTKLSLKRADKIYAVSKDISKKIVSNFDIPVEKVAVVPFGVNTELFRPGIFINRENNKIIVFSNRSFFKVYNIENLIQTIPKVVQKKKNIFFIIKGSGPLEDHLKKLADSLNLNDHITFLGWSKYEDMPEYLHNSDIYVSTAISDGTPVSVLEAMACGKACIVTDVGGVSEWIKNDINGLLIPPGQTDILTAKILDLAENSEKRKELGKEARKTITMKGDWNKIMKWVRNDYEDLKRSHEI